MRRAFVRASTAKRFVHRNLLEKGKPGTASPSFSHFSFCCCWVRASSSVSGDLRESLSKTRLREIKLDDAIDLFSEMVNSRPVSPIVDFSKLLSAIAKMKKFDVVISLGEQMQNLGISHNLYTYNILINCFCRRSQLSLALALLGKMLKLGYEPDIVTLSSLLNGYCHGTRISDAVALIDQMMGMGYQPNTVTFNTLIHGLFLHNRASEAVALVERMVAKGCQPNLVTYGAVLNGLCKRGDIDLALNLLKKMDKGKIEADVIIYNTIIDGLCKYRNVDDALKLINEMDNKGIKPDVFTYNSLISCLCKYGRWAESAGLLSDMIEKKISPNVITPSALIDAFAKEGKVGDVVSARVLFDQMKDRDTISWNTMIDGYVHASRMEDAFALFSEMPNRDTHSWNMMVSGYASVGNVELARHYFEKTPEKTTVSWNSIIAAYEKNKEYKEAFDVFIQMNIEGEKPDPYTLTSLLSVSTGLVNLHLGMQMHQIILKTVIPNVPIHNALITMYSRCGLIVESRRIFDDMKLKREVITWNAMIGGYAFHGNASEALNLFWSMKSNRIHPSHITFVTVLNACAHAGLVDEAKAQFVSMVNEYKIEPQMEHYSSLVNVISGQGQFEEAMDVINSMPFEPDKTVWGALLDACRIYNNVRLAHIAAEAMARLEPESSTPYVLLYNMYADMGLWDEASQVRMMMESKRIKKERGSSWIDSST